MQYVEQTVDQFRSRWNNYKSDPRQYGQGATCMQRHLLNHFCASGHCSFLKDVSLTLIDKTNTSDPLKREDYLRLWNHFALI